MKTKWIILFLLLAPIINSCDSCCGCEEPKRVNYSHKTLMLKNLDNSGETIVESDVLQFNKNAYGIRLYLTREENTVAYAKQINPIFIQSAYAFDCFCLPEYVYKASDSIISMKIITLNKFDDQHFVNSDITDYFRIAGSYSTIENHVAKERYTIECDFATFLDEKSRIDLLLMTAPTMDNKHQFKIEVELSDGRILEEQTPEIELL